MSGSPSPHGLCRPTPAFGDVDGGDDRLRWRESVWSLFYSNRVSSRGAWCQLTMRARRRRRNSDIFVTAVLRTAQMLALLALLN